MDGRGRAARRGRFGPGDAAPGGDRRGRNDRCCELGPRRSRPRSLPTLRPLRWLRLASHPPRGGPPTQSSGGCRRGTRPTSPCRAAGRRPSHQLAPGLSTPREIALGPFQPNARFLRGQITDRHRHLRLSHSLARPHGRPAIADRKPVSALSATGRSRVAAGLRFRGRGGRPEGGEGRTAADRPLVDPQPR